MWFKALTPYMLIITDNNPLAVGNMMTLNGLTRALVGVASGRLMINKWGVDNVWVITGFVGFLGILVNVVCLCKTSVAAAYGLNFVWAVYNGLWNSCLEVSWARSILQPKRADVNGARQMTNKITTALGPLFSAAIFLCYGNQWDIALIQNVMLLGTGMTALSVVLCFCFRSSQEVDQEISLREVDKLLFAASPSEKHEQVKEITCAKLTNLSFKVNKMGYVMVTYPLGVGDSDSWHDRVRILTRAFEETPYILVKQFHAALVGVTAGDQTCILFFSDYSRAPQRVQIESLRVFLTQVEDAESDLRPVNLDFSTIRFNLNPLARNAPTSFSLSRVVKGLMFGSQMDLGSPDKSGLHTALLQTDDAEGRSPTAAPKLPARDRTMSQRVQRSQKGPSMRIKEAREDKRQEQNKTNISGANVIVVCDVLNAFGAGFSLKFIDLFLKVDYGVSPAGVFAVAFLQNIFGACLTPVAKKLLAWMSSQGYRQKLGVVLLWSLALCFLATLCIPGMPIWVVIPSIVMMQALNSCTRAYNRAALVNYLPKEKIATYMFIVLAIRTLIYLAFTLRKGSVYKGSYVRQKSSRENLSVQTEDDVVDDEDMQCVENIRGNFAGEEESQMFQQAEALALASELGGNECFTIDEVVALESSKEDAGLAAATPDASRGKLALATQSTF
eukprot:TRINITY_DN29487_c0_g2_i2.p1 TRINITY_DN29487_c0_g2~~TRINITY_DN29487_c0_g2_i2.p1  ORF type:complete len:733 (-),score=144.21 TRINITY_DN29487_c0_g2_i2:26-2041(-)